MKHSICVLRVLLFCVISCNLMTLGHAQDYRAKLQGTVADASGGALPGAKVVLRNVGTGVEVTRQTNGEGLYIFDFVESGTYTVLVEAQGFKKFEQRNILVQNRGDITVNVKMEIGGVSEVVTIQDTPVAVQFNSSSDSTTIGNELINQLPLRGRNPYNVVALDPTINGGENANGENRPYHHAFANEFDAGGGTTRANDIQLDGVPLTSSYKTSYTPSIEAVQEVSFQKNAVDAEYGYSAGGVITLNMKSGTNRFHGSGYYHNRDPRFNAFGDPTIPRTAGADETIYRGTRLKMYGGTIGGPIVKNKVFFFSSWEQWYDHRPITVKLTVPTALERKGDFSQSRIGAYTYTVTPGATASLCGGSGATCARPVYDPLTSTGTSGLRAIPFLNNIIPANRFDPTAAKLIAETPLPNLPGNDLNWQGTKTENVGYWNLSNRVDWNVNEKLKAFVRYGYFKTNLLEAPQDNTTGKLFPAAGSHRNGLSIAADTVYTISSSKVLNVRANYHKLIDEFATSDDYILGKSGIESLWPNNPWYTSLFTRDLIYYPAVNVLTGTTNNQLGRPGSSEYWQRPQGWGGSARMNWYAGNHNLKFGGELRVDKGKGARFIPLNLNFRAQNTASQNTSANINTSGNEWATMLLGVLDANTVAQRIPVQEVVTLGYAAYFQDDFKVNSRLTLNLGLRWEYEPGPVDRQNRLSQRLDLTNPIPEFQTTPPNMPASVLALLATKGYKPTYNGACVFTDANNRNAWSRQALNLLPRIGGAFKLDSKSVLRFGYARYLSPSSKIRDPLGAFVTQYAGYSTSSNPLGLSTVNGNTGVPVAFLSNPFPTTGTFANPLQQPTEKALGRYTNLGNAVSLDQYELKPQNNDRYSLSYQREVWKRTIVSFDFFYNNGTNLPIDVDLNQADPNFLYDQPRSVTNASVANPFRNYLTTNVFPGALRNGAANVTVATLLRPYPQYGAITQTNTALRKLHVMSYKVQAQRPFAQGLSLLVNYAYQTEEQTEFFDDRAMYARELTWRPLPVAHHRFNHAVTWEIPVGKGRWLLKSAPLPVDLALGGWQLTTTNRWYSGRQLIFNQNLIVSGNPHLDNRTLGPNGAWFDKSVFAALPVLSAQTDPVNIRRTNPWTYDGVVGPGTSQVDMTLSKSFRIHEGWKFEFRVEGYNVANHINWDNPVVDFNNTANFGKVISKRPGYIGREVQYGFKLTF
ncbi:MAG: carboxypeptidase regulatory-like domain-containing protein [Acidobacteria bacterium]|nr:carboxypeptidase regulatory-like domain-containing protein [Acidobacteriota bacterium]